MYKEQLKQPNCRIIEYPFDKYFDQQVKELESAAGTAVENRPSLLVEDKKDTLVDADNGGPPPPPIPGLLPGRFSSGLPFSLDILNFTSAASCCAGHGELK